MSLTNQQAFNIIWERAKDPRKAEQASTVFADGPKACRYLVPETGLKCFVGACIPPGEFREQFDGPHFYLLDVKEACPSLKDVSMNLLLRCRNVHDEREPEDWLPLLRGIAGDLKLTVPE